MLELALLNRLLDVESVIVTLTEAAKEGDLLGVLESVFDLVELKRALSNVIVGVQRVVYLHALRLDDHVLKFKIKGKG